jgi:hypothetical protein
MTARTEQSEQDIWNKIAKKEQPEQASQNRPTRTGQPKQDSQSRTDGNMAVLFRLLLYFIGIQYLKGQSNEIFYLRCYH